MTRDNASKPPRNSKADVAPDPPDPDKTLRELARRHCATAIAALAAVVADAEAPAGARITAATTLLGWAFGREGSDTSGKGQGARKPPETEQVIRLAWMETKARNRGKSKKPKKGPSKGKDDKRVR